MVELAIIADDLTGALDAAAPFATRGIGTVVALSPDALPRALEARPRIVGVSTDSRETAPEAANAAVRAALAHLPAGTPIFKKVDSRLKGNVAAELDAIAHHHSLVVPAIPAFGRITRQGRVEGFGVSAPIDIAARLGRHAAVARIPDIERALEGHHDLVIGARGLAEAMACAMARKAIAPDLTLRASAAYCIIGSTDPITLAQLEHLRRAVPDLTDIAAPNGIAPVSQSRARLTVIQAVPADEPATGKAVAQALAASLMRLDPPDGKSGGRHP
jgi:uncharacterized protein YgbK (DUF1537 family)